MSLLAKVSSKDGVADSRVVIYTNGRWVEARHWPIQIPCDAACFISWQRWTVLGLLQRIVTGNSAKQMRQALPSKLLPWYITNPITVHKPWSSTHLTTRGPETAYIYTDICYTALWLLCMFVPVDTFLFTLHVSSCIWHIISTVNMSFFLLSLLHCCHYSRVCPSRNQNVTFLPDLLYSTFFNCLLFSVSVSKKICYLFWCFIVFFFANVWRLSPHCLWTHFDTHVSCLQSLQAFVLSTFSCVWSSHLRTVFYRCDLQTSGNHGYYLK